MQDNKLTLRTKVFLVLATLVILAGISYAVPANVCTAPDGTPTLEACSASGLKMVELRTSSDASLGTAANPLYISGGTSGSGVTVIGVGDGGGVGTSGVPMRVDPVGTTTQPVNPTAVIISTARIGDCATNAGDGGVVSLTANARYRCVARNNAVCVNNGAAVTTCSASAIMAPNGMYVPPDAPEEMTFAATYAGTDAGANNGLALIYLASTTGTGCFSCSLLTPQ